MIIFITFLRALAACFITNAHYVGIYPTDLIANGGLVGDILFFSVSGYCLYNINLPFIKWYAKRIYRIYPAVLIITFLYVILGRYSLNSHNCFWWFVYPTYYHFVASIIVLYIPFYFCIKITFLKDHLLSVMGLIAVIWLTIYFTIYDKSYYHIDNVREPMIRFLYMESMLIGAWFRQKDQTYRDVYRRWYLITLIPIFTLYIISKISFSKIDSISNFQIINQFVILFLLYIFLLLFASLDSKLSQLPNRIKQVASFIATITLEIYLVQYVIIDICREIGHFPLNWIVITTSIIASAYLLHKVSDLLYIMVDKTRSIILKKD